MTDLSLEERLESPESRDGRVACALATLYEDGQSVGPSVLEHLARIIREPESVARIGDFASLLVDICDVLFITPLVEMIGADLECNFPHTSAYMYALGIILEETDQPDELFSEEFIAQLGCWLLTTGGGELSWKSGIILHNIRVPSSYEFMRKGASDASLFFLTRIQCLKGLVNGRGAEELSFLASLGNDSDPRVRGAVADALRFLGQDGDETSTIGKPG